MDIPRVSYDPRTQKSHGGNVVQIVSRGTDFIRVGITLDEDKGRHIHHSDILGELLKELGVSFDTKDEDGYKIPLGRGQDYELVGAGECWTNDDGSHDFYGRSASYNIGINRGQLERMVPFFPESVTVRFGRWEDVVVLGRGHGRVCFF